MKSLITYALCCFLCWAPMAVYAHPRALFIGGGSTAAAPVTPSYFINQNFEGTGYDNSESWITSTGTPNADYTTFILAGSQSLLANTASTACRIRIDFTAKDEVYGYFLFRREGSNPGGDRLFFELTNNGGTTRTFGLSVTSTGAIKVEQGTANATTTGTMSVGTTYHIFYRWVVNSGSTNGIGTVAFSTDGSNPTSGANYKETIVGTSTTQAGRMWLGYTSTNANASFIYDRVLASVTSISTNP